jgi:hypothetical protein
MEATERRQRLERERRGGAYSEAKRAMVKRAIVARKK